MMGNTSMDELLATVSELEARDPGPMDEPYIAIRIEKEGVKRIAVENAVALHASLAMDPFGEFITMEGC